MMHRPPESPFRATLTHAPRYHEKNDSFCRKPAGVCTSRRVCSRSIGGCAGRNGRVSSLKLSAEMSPNLSPAWVQVWMQLKNEKWLPISRKRHQIGHLDFRSFRLLTECSGFDCAPTVQESNVFNPFELSLSAGHPCGVVV